MNSFKNAKEILDVIKAGEETRRIRSENRAKVDKAVNGEPYLSPEQQQIRGKDINVNWGELPRLAAHARRQYEQALLGPEHYFKVTIRTAPPIQQSEWSSFVTGWINRRMKEDEDNTCVVEYQIGALVNHGIGPEVWRDPDSWKTDFIAIDDLIIATDTNTSFKNLEWFGERMAYTEGELTEKVFGPDADKRWNKPAIQKILDRYHPLTYSSGTDANWNTSPEKMADLVKQSGIYFSSDAVRTIPLIHFYYKECKKGKKATWKMCVVPDVEMGCMGYEPDEFLYESGDKFIADSIHQLLCVQFGDLNSKAPYKYHAVRSLGFQLFEPCFWTNIVRSGEVEHLIQSLDVWLQVTDPGNKARPQKFNISNNGVMPPGIRVVPNTERYQVDPRMIEMVMSQLKQLQAEIATSYTQDIDTGTSKEQTAFEVQTKLSQVNAVLAGLLGRAFRTAKRSYKEKCRRFCLKKSRDEDAQAFQAACKKERIPPQYIDVEQWDVEPEIPMGAGNQTMAMAQAQQLMAILGQLDPSAQRIVKHEYVEAVTGNARMAKLLAPVLPEKKLTNAMEFALTIFSDLMVGVKDVPVKEGLPLQPQIDTLMGLLSGVMMQISPETNLTGIENVVGHIQLLLSQLGQDPSQQEYVKAKSEALGKMVNEIRQVATEIQKERDAGMASPESQAKAAAVAQDSQGKNKIDMESHQLDMELKKADFQRKAQQDNESHLLDAKLKSGAAHVDAETTMQKTDVDIKAVKLKAETQARALAEKTRADIAAKEKMAEANAEAAEKKANQKPEPVAA